MPPERRGLRPRPPGLRPRPLPCLRHSGAAPPLLLPSREGRQAIGGKRSFRPWGEAPEVGAPKARKPRVSRWATRRVVHGPPRRARAGVRNPRPGIQLTGRRPAKLGVAKPPQSPQGSRLSEGKCSESTSRRKWQNGAMAHFAILRTQKLKSAVAVHRSMKHSFRAQDTPNADAELAHHNEHFGAHSVAEGMAAFRARLPESFRKDAVQAIEYLMTASPESDGQQEPGRAGCVFPGRAGLAEGSPWRGKRGLCRHPPGRDHAAHVRLRGAARPRDWTTQRQEVVGWCQGAAGHANRVCGAGRQAAWPRKGLEGSKSRHTTIKDYYGRVEKGSEQTPRVDVPDPSMGIV